jgi:hypothetical protein
VAEVDRQLRASDSFVIFLSEVSIRSDMLRQEVQTAYERRQEGKLSIFPVRLDFQGKLPYDLAAYLNRLQYALWRPGDSETELFALLHTAITGGAPLPVAPSSDDDAPGSNINSTKSAQGERHRDAIVLPSRGASASSGKRRLSGRLAVKLFMLALFIAFLCVIGGVSNFPRRLAKATFNKTELPLSASETKRLDSLIGLLGEMLYQRYWQSIQQDGSFIDGWEGAQILVALNGLSLPHPIDYRRVAYFFRKTRSDDCHCWKERPWDAKGRSHIGSTAWVIYAKARLGIPAESEELRFLLSNQNPEEGAWPMFPCRENDSDSTYASAWALLALGEQARRGLVKEPLLTEIRNSTRSGLTWLEEHRMQDGFWRSYPGLAWSAEASLSNSGLAIYVLHHLQSKLTRDIDNDIDHRWMSTLSARPEPVYAWEAFNGFLCEKENSQSESVHYLVVPWKLVATVEAYPQGNLMGRERAIDFAESLISKENLLAETKSQGWVAAELLIALRHMRAHYLSD